MECSGELTQSGSSTRDGNGASLQILKAPSGDTLPPTKPHLLSLSKPCGQLETRHENA